MNTISFQIVDISSDDLILDKGKSFVITLYGINQLNERLVCHVTKYLPYFYLKIPNDWDQPTGFKLIKRDICGITPGYDDEDNIFNSITRMTLKSYKDFYGLYWNKESKNIQHFNFLKISFTNYGDMKKLITKIKKHYNLSINDYEKLSQTSKVRLDQWRSVKTTVDCDSNLYESGIHPIIKFIHDSTIEPTGWVQCTRSKNEINTGLFTSCDHEYTCSWKDIHPVDNNSLSSYRIASFDIECDSAHGDFPLPQKNFKKLASDMFDSYQSILKKSPESRRLQFNENCQNHLEKLLLSGFTGDFSSFNSVYKYASMNKIHTLHNEIPSDEVIKTIISKIYDSSLRKDNYDIMKYLFDIEIKGKERDTSIETIQSIIEEECTDIGISVQGDPIIQIGTVFYDYGTDNIFRHILVIAPDGTEEKDICDDIPGITVERCKNEADLLMGWKRIINKMDPDFITGYNIFGFDFRYIHKRAECLFPCHKKCKKGWYHAKGCQYRDFMNFGKLDSTLFQSKDHRTKRCSWRSQELTSSALGENTLNYITMDGRILFDIQKEVEKAHNLESYKLDNVSAHFMRGKLKHIDDKTIVVSSSGHLKNGDFVSFRTHNNIGEGLFEEGKKYQIESIHSNTICLTESLNLDLDEFHKVEWCLNKDDISPQDIFDKHQYGTGKDRAEVAKYCVQDCELCINLLMLLDIIPNNLGMANVSYVPASFIFLRGQGVKVTSVVSRMCSTRHTRIPELKKSPSLRDYIKMYNNGSSRNEIIDKMIEDADWRRPEIWELEEWYRRVICQSEKGIEGFEGAIVLDPTPGIYLDDPIAVLDYASLYPSSIIEKNLSHETYIEDVSLLSEIGEDNYHKVEFQDWIYKNTGKGDTIEKLNAGTKTKCYFLKPEYMKEKKMIPDDEAPMGIIPAVLDHLLSARKRTKKLMGKETDEFKKKVLDGLQLAYKVTANSVYGQLGAKTSTIFKMNIAACTTSIGRSRIDDASFGVKEWANKKGYLEPDVIYGDTDSVFVKFSREVDGKLLKGKEALKHCIQCGREAGDYITKGELIDGEGDEKSMIQYKPMLNHPQDLEYEKTFWPFILISKKRYTGDKYEYDINECKRTSMGIVLKRRDNAQIVKHVFGNVIEKIMIEKDFDLTVNWLKETLQQIRNEEFNLRYFVITKALRGYYKNPKQIAHKVLADRMAARDPGNKPKSNDRIPYAYIKMDDTPDIVGYKKKSEKRVIGEYKNGKPKYKTFRVDDMTQPKYKKKVILQGDRIEHVDYIKKKDIPIDYEFYITNQIMNPVKQVLDLEMDSTETNLLFK